MFNSFIDEINQYKYIFLVSLQDNNDSQLHIQISISNVRPSTQEDNQDLINKIPKIKSIISNSNIIEMDKSTIYDIYFQGYFSYNIRYESRILYEDYEISNLVFRVYEKSKFLDYFIPNTILFDDENDKIKHYQICCEWQVIDIISNEPPTITKIKFRK